MGVTKYSTYDHNIKCFSLLYLHLLWESTYIIIYKVSYVMVILKQPKYKYKLNMAGCNEISLSKN